MIEFKKSQGERIIYELEQKGSLTRADIVLTNKRILYKWGFFDKITELDLKEVISLYYSPLLISTAQGNIKVDIPKKGLFGIGKKTLTIGSNVDSIQANELRNAYLKVKRKKS